MLLEFLKIFTEALLARLNNSFTIYEVIYNSF